jgi:DNA polymerase III alpha subunit
MNYINYHCHSQYSNVSTPDSTISNKDRAWRAKNLGQTTASFIEHGWCGRVIEGIELAKELELKPILGTEAYFVKNRLEKDATNAHLIILAKNENGRKSLNKILSQANIDGFYYKPRLDLGLVLSLPKNDLWVTTACVGGIWKYEDAEDVMLKLLEHFQQNLFLEVQNHWTDKQKILNERILRLSNQYNIKIIAGMDSHLIFNSQNQDRDNYLQSRGIVYPDEENWFLDYPDYTEAFSRFEQQGILNSHQIEEALGNTNIFESVESYNSKIFDSSIIKLPTLYPDKSQEEKDKVFCKLVWEKWEEEKTNILEKEWEKYKKEIQKELDVVIKTGMADYFLLDYEIIKKGKELGGQITLTGRGSAPSFYLSKLLGFTTVDRISATVKLFPERFISAERLLETKSLPDIDFNLGNPEVFAKAQEEVLGCGHSYPMIAFGTVKTLGAWKIYARVADIDFDIANAVSEQIQAYEMDLKHAETDEEKEEINILDYIGYQYQNAFRESSKFLGLVNTLTPHPCAYLLYSDGDVREEFGLIKIKTGDVEHICVCCDGLFAENYKFLKNDLLKVNVVKLIYGVYNRIGIEPHPLPELLKICKNDKKVWDIYATATTMGINQVEQTGSSGRVAKYKPQNISEISAFVAAIRPGFKSNYKQFESREPFCYGIPSLDNLIQTKEFPYSYLIYQENSMQAMAYAGIPISQTYEIVKNIAKKRVEKVLKYKEQFVSGMKKKIKTQEKVSDKEAEDISNKTWQIIEDSSRYAFNSSHSYSVAGDSLYGAYLKSHYPLEFYEVFLQMLEEDGDKDRLADVRKEAEKEFHIKFPRFRFGQDNRNIVANKERNEITSSLKTLKGFGGAEGERLYDLSKQFSGKDFLELLIFAEENGGISSKWESLLKIDYFADFGNNQKLLSIFKEFKSGKNRYSKKLTDKSKEKRIPELRKIFDELPNNKLPIVEQVRADVETLGTIQSVFPEIKINKEYRIAYVLDLNLKYSPRVQLYNLKAGNQMSFKIRKMFFNNDPFDVGTVILCKHFEKKKPTKYVNGKYEENPDADFEYWIDNYSIIENFDEWMKRNG